MACIPQIDLGRTKPVTPLMAVRKVDVVEMVSGHRSDGTILFKFQMNIEGAGVWSDEIPIYISRDL
ncbi:hypothetical protein D3C77_776570 [compost metagenome]